MNRLEWRVRCLATALCAVAAVACAARPGGVQSDAREWNGVIRLGGTPVGSHHETTAVRADGTIATRTASRWAFGRVGKMVEVSMVSTTEESAAGALRRISAELRMSHPRQASSDATWRATAACSAS
jgi:hypothetical protein